MYLWLQWSSCVSQLGKVTLECHWKTNGRSNVVCPVVSQCTESIWFECHKVRSLPSMQTLMYTTGMATVVWAKLIPLVLPPQIHENYNGAHIQDMPRVMLKYSRSPVVPQCTLCQPGAFQWHSRRKAVILIVLMYVGIWHLPTVTKWCHMG